MVAGTCKHLQLAAAAKFGIQYGKMTIYVHLVQSLNAIDEYVNDIMLDGLRFGLPFLRCFGAKLSNLMIVYDRSTDRQIDHLHNHVSQ